MEWVEVKGPSIEVAVAAALEELGIASEDEAEIEVIQQPEKGFLGMGRREAVVRVKSKPTQQRRKRRRRGGRDRSDQERGSGDRSGRRPEQRSEQRSEQRKEQRSGQQQGQQRSQPKNKPSGRRPQRERSSPGAKNDKNGGNVHDETTPTISPEEREQMVSEFLSGVLTAFDLDGSVEVRTEDDILFADVVGDQTEALVGPKGAVMQSLHELTRTVVQRKTQEGVRLRLDVAGYAARRREALSIYANRLVDQLKEEGGGEVMLEPMNPADRKVIHDAVAELDGAESFSEGEEPRRSVVISFSAAE